MVIAHDPPFDQAPVRNPSQSAEFNNISSKNGHTRSKIQFFSGHKCYPT
jgi:hypothetical protein